MNHEYFIGRALQQAWNGHFEDGIPIGAVLVKDGKIISEGRNRRTQKGSVILHAEMDCLENAGQLSVTDYRKCTMYSTLSPCSMCSGAIRLYQIPLVVIGEHQNFHGPEWFLEESGIKVINLDNEDCKDLLRDFIKNLRMYGNRTLEFYIETSLYI